MSVMGMFRQLTAGLVGRIIGCPGAPTPKGAPVQSPRLLLKASWNVTATLRR
jgi:hypothetical protein